MTSSSSQRRCAVFLTLTLLGALLPEAVSSQRGKKKRRAENAADLKVVDCLLPGKIRRLGTKATFVGPRRPVRTSAVDCQIRGGEYTAHDRASYATSLTVWLPQAEAGDAEAQTYVGEIFEKGPAGVPDYESAAVWYRRAAEQDHSRAQINLGHLYEKGLGVPLDPQTALEWYRRAAGISEAVVLDWTQQEAVLRQEADELRTALGQAQAALEKAQSELERAQEESRELRRQLEEARQSEAGQAAKVGDLEARLRKSEGEVAKIRRSIREHRDRLAQLKARDAEDTRLASPAIAIIRPDVLSTRGPSIVPVPGDVSELEVTGRVTAPAGLDRLTIDGVRSEVDPDGFFRWVVTWGGTEKKVALMAVDQRGQTTHTELLLRRGGKATVVTESPPPSSRRRKSPSPDLHALILSVAKYDSLPDLATVRADTAEVERLLGEKYGFQTTVLEDPTQFEILSAINDLAGSLREKDQLLIYYAGHGKIREEKGYWIGADGAENDPALWIPNEAISDQLDVMRARHVLVVSDSCYSGTLTRSGVARTGGTDGKATEKRSRTVLTSGELQPVLDEGGGRFSIFAQAFLRVLELNEEALAGTDLHREVSTRVRFAARALGFRQRPDYAAIRFAGHGAGDFVLVPRMGS